MPKTIHFADLESSATVFIEGDCSTNTYTDANGNTRSGFSIVQRTLLPPGACNTCRANHLQGSIEVLRRPQHTEHAEHTEQSQ